MENKIDLALKWFKDNDVSAYQDDGSIYVIAGRDADVQISTIEVDYRAELQKQFYDSCKEVFKK